MYKAYLNRLKSEKISEHRHKEKLTSLINKKTIRYHLDKLIREYNILPEERKPLVIVKHVLKTLFWATVYLTFSYLTITWSFKVIEQYRDNQTTTNMKAIVNNNVTYLPNMTICFKINISELFNVSSSSSFNYTSAWSRFFKKTVSHEGIFKVNESQIYDDEIYLSLLKYLAMIYEAERAWEPGRTQISTFHSEESDDWIALKQILVPNIKRFNITLKLLKSLFGEKLCSLPASDYSYNGPFNLAYESSLERECVARSKISFIGMDTICFRLIGYKNSLNPRGRTNTILLHPYNDGKNQSWCQEYTIDLGSESRTTPRRASTRNETYAYYYNRFTGSTTIFMQIGIRALYRKLPNVKGDLQCSSDTSQEECENKCLRGWIRANCHCSPITFNLTAYTLSYRSCTVDDYSICMKKYTENATYLCINKCVPLCEQWHYKYFVFPNGFNSNGEVRFGPKAFDYVIIEQMFTWNSFEEFIGALGGTLGIWLGLDFVIIIEFIVKLVRGLSKKILLRSIHNSEDDKQGKRAYIKHREENFENGISSSNEIGSRVDGRQNEFNENKSEIVGTSIRHINEKQITTRKTREENRLKEKYVQQKRKHSNKNRAILDDKTKNAQANNGRLRNQRVTTTHNVDAVQDESTEHANYSSARSSFLQKMLGLFLYRDVPTNKRALFLRLVEKLFWVSIYLVGSIFTTRWCIELINLYLADEAVYYPSLITNRTVSLQSLQPLLHCVRHHNNHYIQNHSNISNALTDYFGQLDINRASFIQISDGKNWSEPLVSIALLYFSIQTASETGIDDVRFISEYERQLDYLADYNISLRNDIEISLNDILLPKLLEWNITANELQQKLGAEVARMAELKITFTNSKGTTDIVKEASIYTAAITDQFLCYGLSYVVSFTDPDDALVFSINSASCPQLLSVWYAGQLMYEDYLLDPESARRENSEGDLNVYEFNSFRFEYGMERRILISVLGVYTSRSVKKGVKYCSPNTTKLYCRAQCRIELIEKLCNCSPTYWTAMVPSTSGLDECTFDRYMKCLNFSASDDRDCIDSCIPSCTARYFRSDLADFSISQEYKDTALLRLSVKGGIYESIEEKPTFTFSDLLIKLGGTLGILLGFCIFSFYQVLVIAATLYSTFILERTRFVQNPLLLESLDKIKKSGIAQVISYLNQQLISMNICGRLKKVKMNDIGKNILLKTGYMIGLYTAVRMSNKLFHSFNTGEPKCDVDLMMNATINLPSSTICVPLNTVEFLSKKEIRHFENNIDLARKLDFNSFYDKEELFRERWPTWLMQWVHEYLIIYDTVERHGNHQFISALFPDNNSYASNESGNIISKYSFTTLTKLDELIDHLNITILELKQNLGQKIRDIYKTKAIFVKEVDGVRNQTVLNITATTFIGEAKICYKLPSDTVMFSSKSDYIAISLDRRSLPNLHDLSDYETITIDFSGRDFSKPVPPTYFYSNIIFGSTHAFYFGESSFRNMDISEIYEAMPVSSGVRRCSERKSMDICLNECQQKKLERFCNCSPATWPNYILNTNLTRCHLLDYKRCAKSLVSSDVDLCELNCVPHCTRINFVDESYGDSQSIGQNVAEIFFKVNSFEYLSHQEVYKYTMTDFISEFGGILGIWIGLDFLAFVELFHWVVCKGWHIFRQFL